MEPVSKLAAALQSRGGDQVSVLQELLSCPEHAQAAQWLLGQVLGTPPEAAATAAVEEGTAPASAPPIIRADCTATDFEYPADTRQEERWAEDSPEYLAGNERHNRYKPPPPEIEGDIFDRQRCIIGFDQGLIESQVCLVLGTGGIGQDAALALARLGVGKIVLVDCDDYDASNLTRQCLGSVSDVGGRKVDVAARNLKAGHNLRSVIETHHIDAMAAWPRVVELARGATVVFNGIDIGPMWDFCVNSLCKALKLPYVAAQSFDWRLEVEFFSGAPGKVCEWCGDARSYAGWGEALAHHFCASKSTSTEATVRFLAFLAAKQQAVASGGGGGNGSDAGAGDAGVGDVAEQQVGPALLIEFLSTDPKLRMSGPSLPDLVHKALAMVGGTGLEDEHWVDPDSIANGAAWVPPLTTAAELPAFLQALSAKALQTMLPSTILTMPDVLFIPRPQHLDTRAIGSWVCVCLTAGVLMVSQWAAYLTGRLKNPPTNLVMGLDEGMTEGEETALQMIQLLKQGVVPLDAIDEMVPPKGRANDPCKEFCLVCKAAETTVCTK